MNFNFNFKDMPRAPEASIRCVTNARDRHRTGKSGIKRSLRCGLGVVASRRQSRDGCQPLRFIGQKPNGMRQSREAISNQDGPTSISRMEQMTRTKILAMVLLCACSAPAIEKSNFTFSVAYGSHPVGFRVVEQYDYTRSYQ